MQQAEVQLATARRQGTIPPARRTPPVAGERWKLPRNMTAAFLAATLPQPITVIGGYRQTVTKRVASSESSPLRDRAIAGTMPIRSGNRKSANLLEITALSRDGGKTGSDVRLGGARTNGTVLPNR